VKINGITHYLWRAVNQEGEVLEVVATKQRKRRAALRFLRKLMRQFGRPRSIVADRLRTYGAALTAIGATHLHECRGRWINNRAENSHQPLRRRERAMLRFRNMRTLQKFASIHAAVHNHFNHERHLVRRQTYKQRRSAAMAEWGALAA
jgi:putative transposase